MKKNVLIVEDDKDIQDYYEIVLAKLDVDILKAENGEEALQIIDSGKTVDLVLLDVIMPVMDGLTFYQEIREKRELSIPVVPCSVDDGAINRLKEMGGIQETFLKFSKADTLRSLVRRKLNI
jgi:CheY-like chemotaxis protein